MAADDAQSVRAQRERWRLAKRAQRGSPIINVRPVSSDFKLAVLAERDRRKNRTYREWANLCDLDFEMMWRKSEFAADVWAAREMLIAELGVAGNSPTRIATWLKREGLTGSYAEDSVRPMVYDALDVIRALESACLKGSDEPFWTPFKFNATGD